MAEIVGSAVVQESVNQILSGMLQTYEEKQSSNAFRNLERLEMAHIRLEAVLQTSEKWEITDTSLLRWRRKLKSAARECNDTLHRCRQRILHEEHIEKEKDHNAPDDDFCLTVSLQISESTDIVGVAIQCLQLFAPLFKSMVEKVREELMQLPTQDFLWVPYYLDPHQQKFWDNVHRFGSQWFRPNPLCCKEHDKDKLCLGSQLDKSSGLPFVSLDRVIEVGLRCQVLLSECNKQTASLSEYKTSAHDHPCLKAGVLFAPHGSSEDMLLADKFPAIAAIYSEEQHFLHKVFTLGQLEEIMLSEAIDYFCQHEEARVYQMVWRSRHGTAYIRFERASIIIPSTRQTFYGAKRRKLLQGQDEELEFSMKYWVCHFLDLWAAYAPIQLQASIMDWYQGVKEKTKQHTTAT